MFLSAPSAMSQDVGQFLGEVRSFGFRFCPVNWTPADGKLLPINQNDALFSLYGTTFGGDGRTTFGIPDMRGRALVHKGTGPGLTTRALGQKFGTEGTTQVPQHGHSLAATDDPGTQNNISSAVIAAVDVGANGYSTLPPSIPMDAESVAINNGPTEILNVMPSQGMNFCVATSGLYPTRN